jgi:flagellar protein FliS
MVNGNAFAYQKVQINTEITPQKLILMLYEGAIKRIKMAREGAKRNDPKQRGENIGKAIAIISKLNASLDPDIKTDEIIFLRNLYIAMMQELAKVSVTNNIKTLDRAEGYIMELKRIWETTVLNKPQESQENSESEEISRPAPTYGTGGYGQGSTLRTSIAV